MSRFLLRAAAASMALFLLVILTPLAWYAAAPLRVASDAAPADAIALLSSGQVDADWATPDAAQRLLGALDLYRRGFAPVIVPSGSQHGRGWGQAELAASWLERAGVPTTALVVEGGSTRTWESIAALKAMMAERGWRSLVIVTSDLDVLRVRLVCARLGVRASILGVPEFRPPRPGSLLYLGSGYPVLHHALYEYAALALYWSRGWL